MLNLKGTVTGIELVKHTVYPNGYAHPGVKFTRRKCHVEVYGEKPAALREKDDSSTREELSYFFIYSDSLDLGDSVDIFVSAINSPDTFVGEGPLENKEASVG